MLKPICLGAALGLLSFSAIAASLDAPIKSRTAKPVKVVRAPVHQFVRIAPQVIPPCLENRPFLLSCSPRAALYAPYDPQVWVLQGTLVRQPTPYPILSSWPPYY
jgi:hypothetical protein